MKHQVFSIYFTFNGSSYFLQTQKLWNLKEVLHFFNFSQSLIVFEYNGTILSSEQMTSLLLKNHDKIELLTIVGGG